METMEDVPKDDHDVDHNDDEMISYYDPKVVQRMMEACTVGDLDSIRHIVDTYGDGYVSQQVEETGWSPLMAAAMGCQQQQHLSTNSREDNGDATVATAATSVTAAPAVDVCLYLLQNGAPWNAINRQGQCAGNIATDYEQWDIVNLLVEWGTRAEFILGRIERQQKQQEQQEHLLDGPTTTIHGDRRPVEEEPSTKPNYLRQRLQYTADGQSLLDADHDAVMMEWERPLMAAHAQMLMENAQAQPPSATAVGESTATAMGGRKRVLNVGFGLGIIDTILQDVYQPSHHIIIEAHPDVYQHMMQHNWHTKQPHVRCCFGTWQTVLPQLIAEGVVVDAIFFDTYGEHFMDMEDFHTLMVQILAKPHGIYSFFNGLAPDNIFFHGVACQCVKLQLSSLGLDSEFVPCAIQVKDEVWEGIRRKYWHGRDTYYLPVCTWNAEYLQTGRTPSLPNTMLTTDATVSPTKRKMRVDTTQPTTDDPEAETMDVDGTTTTANMSPTAKRLQTETTRL